MNQFIAASRSYLQNYNKIIEQNIINFGEHQKIIMGQNMLSKYITMCLDEVFFPETCLVAIEPISGYIFIEEFAEKRDADTCISYYRHFRKKL